MNQEFQPSFTAFPARDSQAAGREVASSVANEEWVRRGNIRGKRALMLATTTLLALLIPPVLYKTGASLIQVLIALVAVLVLAVAAMPLIFVWSVSSVRRGGRWSPVSLVLGIASGGFLSIGLAVLALLIWQAESFGIKAALGEYF